MYLYDFGGSEYKKELGKISVINESLGYLVYGRIDLGVNYEGWTVEDVSDSAESLLLASSEDLPRLISAHPAAWITSEVASKTAPAFLRFFFII